MTDWRMKFNNRCAAVPITEKGSLNARLIRERRADLVAALYSGSHPDVLLVG